MEKIESYLNPKRMAILEEENVDVFHGMTRKESVNICQDMKQGTKRVKTTDLFLINGLKNFALLIVLITKNISKIS